MCLSVKVSAMSFRLDRDTFIFCTMPRSGSYYALRFVLHLDQVLCGIDGELSVKRQRFGHQFLTGIDANVIFHHFTSPFMDEARLRDASLRTYPYWSSLQEFPDYPVDIRKQLMDHIDPFYPGRTRVIFVYRNPLDQVVSAIDHLQNQKSYKNIYRFDAKTVETALQWYFKMYYWHFAASQYIVGATQFLCYEDLIRRPVEAWGWLARRLVGADRLADRPGCIEEAMRRSSYKESLLWERKNKVSLANDQDGDQPTHLRGGEIGKWKSKLAGLDKDFYAVCIRHMKNLGIPRKAFIFE
jgi:hypothetical protein